MDYRCKDCGLFKKCPNGEENPEAEDICGDFRLQALNDPVNPNYYKKTYAKEVIDLLQASLTPEEFKGYCKGNMLKYRFRAGYKGDRDEDLKKSNWYQDKLKEVSDED